MIILFGEIYSIVRKFVISGKLFVQVRSVRPFENTLHLLTTTHLSKKFDVDKILYLSSFLLFNKGVYAK